MAKRIHPDIIEEIKLLRSHGWSMQEIKNKIHVGYGTIYTHIKDVTVLPEYKNLLVGKRGGSIKRKLIAEQAALKSAQDTIDSLSTKELLLIMSALYWGEGSKQDFGFCNSDPEMIQVFLYCLRTILTIPDNDLRVSIRIYEDMDKSACLQYWSQLTHIPTKKFLSITILKGKKKGKLSYGMCRIRIRKGGNVLKYVTALKKQIVLLTAKRNSPRSSTDRAQVS